MNNKSKIAIDLFKNQLNKLNNLTPESRYDFANTLKYYIKIYIDPNSEHIASFSGMYCIFWDDRNFNSDKKRVESIIKDCIQTIEKIGVNKQNRQGNNFLSQLDNNTLWAIITFFTVAISFGGFYVGKYHERSELLINHFSTNSNSIGTTDTTANPKYNNIRHNILNQDIGSIPKDK
ncbi:MAG: hypothetical protein LC109_03245 [Bacteroidia bacterium]|nr:hypothetical protein [Ignavibacteria bacterium]MCZ2129262.1 hypothetical protein [Bacteroidia bacterium]